MPVASGGIHAGQMHQLLDLSRRRRGAAVRRRHDRPSRWASRPARPPTAWRSKRMVLARNEGRDIGNEGPQILRDGGAASARRCEQRSIPGATSPSTTRRPTRPTSSATATRVPEGEHAHDDDHRPKAPSRFLPDLTDAADLARRSTTACSNGWAREHRVHRRPASRATPTGRCGACRCSTCKDAAGVHGRSSTSAARTFRRPATSG